MGPRFTSLPHLTPLEAGILVSTSNLTSPLLRIPFGAWVDRAGGRDPTAPMSRGHVEIGRLVNVLSRLLATMPERGPEPADLRHLRRVLYGLHAVLTLHFAQEEEAYLSLLDADPRRPR